MDKTLEVFKPEVFETFGKYAGIGGLALACVLFFFVAVLWFIPQVFGKNRADFRDVIKLLLVMVLCFFTLALLGIVAYVLSLVINKQVNAAIEEEKTRRLAVTEQEETKRRRSDIQGTFLSLTAYMAEAKSMDDALGQGLKFFSVAVLDTEQKGSIIQAFTLVQRVRQEGGTIGGAPTPPPEQQIRTIAGKTFVGARSLQCDGFRRYRIADNRLACGDGRAITYISGAQSSREIEVKYFIVHATASPQKSDIVANFLRSATTASYHLLIDRDGAIIQLVDFNKMAFHAANLNSQSIGIALVNAMQVRCDEAGSSTCKGFGGDIDRDEVTAIVSGDSRTWWHSYSQEQLNTLNGVLAALTDRYGAKDVVGHQHVSKTRFDPGPAFPWAFFGRPTSVTSPPTAPDAADK